MCSRWRQFLKESTFRAYLIFLQFSLRLSGVNFCFRYWDDLGFPLRTLSWKKENMVWLVNLAWFSISENLPEALPILAFCADASQMSSTQGFQWDGATKSHSNVPHNFVKTMLGFCSSECLLSSQWWGSSESVGWIFTQMKYLSAESGGD